MYPGKFNPLIVGVVVLIVIIIVAFVIVGSGNTTTASTSLVSTAQTSAAGTANINSSISNFTIYNGTFSYNVVVGPGGETVTTGKNGSDEIHLYNSTQVASGSFYARLGGGEYVYNGTGKGTGTVVLTTRGYCSGTATVPYTFKTSDTKLPNQANMIIIFGSVMPDSNASIVYGNYTVNRTVTLTCLSPINGTVYTQNASFPMLSTWPLIVSTTPSGSTVAENENGINYTLRVN